MSVFKVIQGLVGITGSSGNELDITADGRMPVEIAPPLAPPGTTAVSDEEDGEISSSNYQNYDIPVGETLVIQRFLAGCEGEGGKGSKVILYYDQPGGDPIQQLELARLYTQSTSDAVAILFTAPRAAVAGDRIRIQRIPSEGASMDVYGKWEGYY